MKHEIFSGIGLVLALGLWLPACGNTSEAKEPDGMAQRKQTLLAKGECTFEQCSALPSSLDHAATVECSGDGDGHGNACAWSAIDPNDTSVSYAPCAESECPSRPAIDCPEGTVKSLQTCGNENDTGCAWTTHCVPPRETTPCADQKGCDGQPLMELAVICSDGTTGGFVCVSDDTRCFWERSCD